LQVSEAQETLKSQAMVTTAGANLSRAIDSWTQDLNDIRNTLQQMSAQLRLTAQQLNASNERNTELAASTPVPSI